MDQATLAFCERIIREQLKQYPYSEMQVNCRTTDLTYFETGDDRALQVRETDLNIVLGQMSKAQEARRAELMALLEKVKIGSFKPFCLGCGIPITTEMFQAHPAEKCPVCRAKTKPRTAVLLNVPRRDDSTSGLYSLPGARKAQRV